jgi:hypothetical protein
MRRILAGLGIFAGLGLASAPASAVAIANINFGNVYGGTVNLETTTLAEQFINPASPGAGSGWGYGYVTSVNGASNYCSVGPCSLYYTVNFTGAAFDPTGTQITFTGTNVELYYTAASSFNLLSQSSAANLTMIQSWTPYANLTGHGNLGGLAPPSAVSFSWGSLTGRTLSLNGNGLLDVNLAGPGVAPFAAFLDSNAAPDAIGGLADIAYTESANNLVLNPKDPNQAACKNGTAATGDWCWQGTLNIRGGAVPEPGTLALLSLALLGYGVTSRRRQS